VDDRGVRRVSADKHREVEAGRPAVSARPREHPQAGESIAVRSRRSTTTAPAPLSQAPAIASRRHRAGVGVDLAAGVELGDHPA
jgi:hypothetical protein